jgi:hypothetical protein
MPAKTILSVPELLEEVIGDQSSDYNDGDNHGYYDYEFDPATGLLTVDYAPDQDAPRAPTVALFRLVSVGVAISDQEGS